MLPKLQQSSIANSLRRDNPTTLLQCRKSLIKVRISSKRFSVSKITNLISLGRINMLLKIPTRPSEISPKSISLKINLKASITNLYIN